MTAAPKMSFFAHVQPEPVALRPPIPGGPRPRALGPERPVEVEIPVSARVARVAAVVPCFNRRGDAEALLGDLSKLDLAGIDLRVLLVDNASGEPLSGLATPGGVNLTHLRLGRNTGGSGGYNAGMARVLGPDADAAWTGFGAEWVWLVDSDARVERGTLRTLLSVLERDRTIVAAGAAICDPRTGRCFELGGHVNRRNGNFEPMVTGSAGVVAGSAGGVIDCDYVAACCALVRAGAIRAAGLFPDTFLNGDDVEWCLRLGQATGGRVVGVPGAVAMHPRFDRFPTWTRYYMARNALGPLRAVGVGRWVRVRRALLEVPRAVQQAMMGRHDLARLHVRALRDAARGLERGPAAAGVIELEPMRPMASLCAALRERAGEERVGQERVGVAAVHPGLLIDDRERAAVLEQVRAAGYVAALPRGHGAAGIGVVKGCVRAAARWVLGPEALVAVVPARGKPDAWFLGRVNVQVAPGGFVLRPAGRVGNPARALATFMLGSVHAVRAGLRSGRGAGRGPSGLDAEYAAGLCASGAGEAMSVEAVVLSYNRWPALEKTLRALLSSGAMQGRAGRGARTITVVDNGSGDGTPARVEEFFPGVRLVRLDGNLGVEAFGRAVDASVADAVVILDDDSIPDDAALTVAIERLARSPGLGAVTLHPVHPASGRSEWRFAGAARGGRDDWPVLGCGNLVLRAAWNSVGGYEKAFFLYRNDADLALKLLAGGWGVHFDPALTIRHDTPVGAGAAKSVKWHELATRNWVWMCRRHGGRGVAGAGAGVVGALLGWAWAHRLSGLSLPRHAATLRGAMAGILSKAPETAMCDGRHLWRLLRLQVFGRP